MTKQVFANSNVLVFIAGLLLLSVMGCKQNKFPLAPVTGTVTIDGEPISELKIVFYPKSTTENPTPGPFSTGETNSEGKFTLVSRYGEPGAVIGPHRVGFELPDDMDEEALGEALSELEEVLAEKDVNQASIKTASDKVAKVKKKMKGFAFVPSRYLNDPVIELEVPSGGLNDYSVILTKE